MRLVVAPDSFKGSADSLSVATAIAQGWHDVRPDDDVLLVPMADGGEGTLDAFATAVPGSRRLPLVVTGPLGGDVRAEWLLLPDGTGVVELAATSGITLLAPTELRAQDATTRGFGEAIAAALAGGATRLLLAVGSSCSTDGGAGALQALGAELTSRHGTPLAAGARGLADLASVDLRALPPLPPGGALIVSDVSNPLLGPTGAAAVFGPQKGATPDDVATMDAALARFARLVAEVAPGAPTAATPGAGAAGGTAFGLLAWGATLVSGSEAVADAVGLRRLLEPLQADDRVAVVTGEGRFDAQTRGGKVPEHVRVLAQEAGAQSYLVAGSIEASTAGFAGAESLSAIAGSAERAIADPGPALVEAGRRLALSIAPSAGTHRRR